MASENDLSYRDLIALVELLNTTSHLREFHLKRGDLEISLSRGAAGDAVSAPASANASLPLSPPTAPPPPPPTAAPVASKPVSNPQAAVRSAPAQQFAPELLVIRSPMVGTYYAAPEPGAAPFIKVGQKIDANATVCIIEVMKLMNSLPASATGVVQQILVDDGAAVEFGQALVVIDPRA